jgi:hypothetical protein
LALLQQLHLSTAKQPVSNLQQQVGGCVIDEALAKETKLCAILWLASTI